MSGGYRPQAPPIRDDQHLVCQSCNAKGPKIPSFKCFYRLPEPWLGMLLKCAHGSLVFMTVCSEACAKKAWEEDLEDLPAETRPTSTTRMVH